MLDHWLAECKQIIRCECRLVPIPLLSGWYFAGDPCRLHHESGRFFSVVGVSGPQGALPMICQPEIGVLGLAVRKGRDGTEVLLQAKNEPGNPGCLVQLAPTLQATRSNLEQLHGGSRPLYADIFLDAHERLTLVDVAQPEQGRFYMGKLNRNVAVEIDSDVHLEYGYRWLSIDELRSLIGRPRLLGMSLRSVLATLVWRNDFQMQCSRRRVDVREVGLDQVLSRAASTGPSGSGQGPPADIVGVAVTAHGREVSCWMQPLLRVQSQGRMVLFLQQRNGIWGGLLCASDAPGDPYASQWGPSIACYGDESGSMSNDSWLDRAESVLFETIWSEDGGRFAGVENRYIVAVLPEDIEPDDQGRWHWFDTNSLSSLLQSGLLSIELRSLLLALWATPIGRAR